MKSLSRREWLLFFTVTKFIDKIISAGLIPLTEATTMKRNPPVSKINMIWLTSFTSSFSSLFGIIKITRISQCLPSLKDPFTNSKPSIKRQMTIVSILPLSNFTFYLSCWIMEISRKKSYYACRTCKKPTEKK